VRVPHFNGRQSAKPAAPHNLIKALLENPFCVFLSLVCLLLFLMIVNPPFVIFLKI
jgi:hypothetical protein